MSTSGCSGRSPTTLPRSPRAGRSPPTSSTRSTPAPVLDDIIDLVGRRRGVRRDAQCVEHRPASACRSVGGTETLATRAVLRVQGPQAKDRLATVFPSGGGQSRTVPRGNGARWGGRRVRRRRYRVHRRGRRGDRRAERGGGGDRSVVGDHRPRASNPPELGARHAAARGLRCRYGHEEPARGSPRCRPASAGSSPGARMSSRGRERAGGRAGPTRVGPGAAGSPAARRPPRAECEVLLDGEVVGALTSGNFSRVLGHGIGLAGASCRRRSGQAPRSPSTCAGRPWPAASSPRPSSPSADARPGALQAQR